MLLQFNLTANDLSLVKDNSFTMKQKGEASKFLEEIFNDLRQVSHFGLEEIYGFAIAAYKELQETLFATESDKIVIDHVFLGVSRNRFPNSSVTITLVHAYDLTMVHLLLLKITSQESTKIKFKIHFLRYSMNKGRVRNTLALPIQPWYNYIVTTLNIIIFQFHRLLLIMICKFIYLTLSLGKNIHCIFILQIFCC